MQFTLATISAIFTATAYALPQGMPQACPQNTGFQPNPQPGQPGGGNPNWTPNGYQPQTGNTAPKLVTVSFTNERTGQNAPVRAPTDGTIVYLQNALQGTPVNQQGQVIATSANIVNSQGNVACTLSGWDNKQIAFINTQKTYSTLQIPGNNLAGAMMKCNAY